MSDYPAAHSMDTDWFAVDACGHVAMFQSGEAGPAPVGKSVTIFPLGFVTGELRYALDHSLDWEWGAHHTGILEPPRGTVDPDPPADHGLWILGPGLESWARERADSSNSALISGRTDGHVWVIGRFSGSDWRWLHAQRGRCLGCKTAYSLIPDIDRCNLHGIIAFEQRESDGTYAAAFVRSPETAPPRPATLESLSREWNLPRMPAFPFCFLEKSRIQPMQWIDVSLFEGYGWEAEDGRIVNE